MKITLDCNPHDLLNILEEAESSFELCLEQYPNENDSIKDLFNSTVDLWYQVNDNYLKTQKKSEIKITL